VLNIPSWLNHNVWDYIAVIYFLVLWVGYSQFSKKMAVKTHCLASILHIHRVWWMQRMLKREVRVADAALLANLERNVNFFASTTMLVIAAILTALTSKYNFVMYESSEIGSQHSQLKLLMLLGIMVYAFFSFTWSLRQFGFGSVLMGAAPDINQADITGKQRKEYAYSTAQVLDQASHAFNYGLRAYYYALASITWFLHPLAFMLATTWVVVVLYRREFRSKPVDVMVMDIDILKAKEKSKVG
jgi:uncharacterized membrane protein